MSDRPTLITLLGAITMLMGIFLAILGAVFLIVPEGSIGDIELTNITFRAVGIAILIPALALIVTAIALLRGWTVAWYLGLIVYGIVVILSLISLPGSVFASAIPLVISIVVIYYLFRPNVKSFFGV